MQRRERDKKVIDDLADRFGVDPSNDDAILSMPETLQKIYQVANSPKIVIAFMYDTALDQVLLATPNIPPDPDAFRTVSEACMMAAKQYSQIARQVERQKQLKEEEETEEE